MRAIQLLAAAEEHSRVMAVYLWLALVTGARRGELCALRWPDVNHAEGDLLVFSQSAILHLIPEVELQEFDTQVCPDPDAPSARKSYSTGPATC